MRNANLQNETVPNDIGANCPVEALLPEIERLYTAYSSITTADDGTYKLSEETAVYDRLIALHQLATHRTPTSIEGAALLLIVANCELDVVLNGTTDFQKEEAKRTIERCLYRLRYFFESQADLSRLKAGFAWGMDACDPVKILARALEKSAEQA